MKKIIATVLACVVFAGFGSHAASAQQEKPKKHRVAVVIDDFGNRMKGTKEMLSLAIPVTVAVMPFLPTSHRDAEEAYRRGHEVIVHLPMEPVRGRRSWLGPGAITTDLTDEEVYKRVSAAIDDIPYAVGVNNHMGSKAMADARIMRIVMQVCRERGLYFLDSGTTGKSKAEAEAEKAGVPFIKNHLFFDDIYTPSHVYKQLQLLSKMVTLQTDTIAIGHVGVPGKMTASALSRTLPELKQTAEFVRVSEMLPIPLQLLR